jgi:hypothetical protein
LAARGIDRMDGKAGLIYRRIASVVPATEQGHMREEADQCRSMPIRPQRSVEGCVTT